MAVVVVGVMGAVVQYSGQGTVKYVKEQVTEVTNKPEIQESWMTDEEAVQAAKDVIRKKELQAELEQIDADIKGKQDRRKEVAKELDSYWTRENVKALIRRTFPEDPVVAIAVASCESGLKPTAYNPNNKNGSTDGGLWQLNSVHDSRLKELGLNKYNPEDATKYARMLYDEQHWSPWVCYNKKMLVMR